MKYEQLKAKFEEGINRLPKTLDADTKYYADVKLCVETNIARCEANKHNIEGVIYQAAFKALKTLYLDLYKKENWNAPRPVLSDLKNKI